MKNCNTILTEKLQKYQHYYQVKLINMNILQVKKYYLQINESGIIEQANFNICLWEKPKKNKEKQLKIMVKSK